VDSLYLPRYAGGIKNIIRCLDKSDSLDLRKLCAYAEKMDSKAVLRRLGFIAELLGLKIKIKSDIGKGYELLDPTQEKKRNYNKEWLLDVNI